METNGHADSSGSPVTPETPFGLGSISKSITAIAVLQLVEAGKIDLDAPIQRYFSTQYKGAEFITVRQLLNQTSGFTQISTFSNTLASVNDKFHNPIEKNALSYAEKFLKGTKQTEHPYKYSNANYVLLGYIVQRVSGQSYGDYVKKHIFSPLSMHDSYVTLDEAAAHGLATPYRRIFGYNVAYDGPFVYIAGDAPAGYMYTSAKDISTVRTAKRCLGPWSPDNSGHTEISIQVISRIVLYFAGLFIFLLLSMTQVVPIWHMATIFQPDVILWLKIMTVLMALKGSMEIIRLVRSIWHEKHQS
ncbi:serine hydrolase domain-containing protein [Neobacillus sp. NPDC097160]|uniref:serine hydrolase domain-containing protein n=1 Tax=Neobacillus sp. NPDC097160 TaxID=3364298 RepID=UPI0038307C9E